MPDAPPKPPGPKAAAKSLKSALTGHKPIVYIIGGTGALVGAYVIHRRAQDAKLTSSPDTALQAPDGTSVPVGTYNASGTPSTAGYPDPTQGAYFGGDVPPDNTDAITAGVIAGLPAFPSAADIAAALSQNGGSAGGTGPGANRGLVTLAPGTTYYDPESGNTVSAPPVAAPTAPPITGGGPPPPPPAGTRKTPPPAPKSPRYITVTKPFGKAKKPYKFHEYETAYGKGDYGKGHSVNMGPA